MEGHLHILFSYSLAPLLFLLSDKALRNRNLKNTLLLGLMLCIFVTGFHPQCIIIYGFFLALFIVFQIFSSIRSKKIREAVSSFNVLLMAGILCFLLSAFSYLPFFFNVRDPYYSSSFGYPIEDAFKLSHKNFIDALTLRAKESWGYKSIINVYTDLGLPDFPVYTLLLIIFLSALCVALYRRDRHTLFFAFSAMLSAFVAKGPHPPFGYLFVWAWHNVPYFAVFRAANRFTLVTALSYAFLVSVLVDTLINYVHKNRTLKHKPILFKVKVEGRELEVSLESLNKLIRSLHNLLYILSIVFLIFILLNGFLSCFYLFSQGLQVYTPPKNYLAPYNWLKNQKGDYKIITTTNSPSEWEKKPTSESDFAFSGMKTSLGWGHDIGYDSSFIHGKPVLQDGGWSPLTRDLISHLRFRLVRRFLTDDFFKILGPFAYKYTVIPEYLSNKTKYFFLNQEGYTIVYNKTSLILENKYYTPRMFAANQYAYVVGGLETFSSICKIDSFNLNNTVLFFAHRLNRKTLFNDDMFNDSEALIFVDSDIIDAVMLSLRDRAIFIKAADYGALSLNYTKYWARATSWRDVGGFVWNRYTLTTCGENSIDIPFKVSSDGIYDLWIRIGFATSRGELNILVDGTPIGEIKPLANFWSKLKWVKVASLNLKRGEHTITLKNDGTGFNDIDTIAIVNSSLFRMKFTETINAIRRYPGRLIYILDAEKAFAFNKTSGWRLTFKPYNGYVLHTDGVGYNVSPKGKASASSFTPFKGYSSSVRSEVVVSVAFFCRV